MVDSQATAQVVDLTDIDLTDGEITRHGFPHETFTTLRREAPVWWQVVPETFKEIEGKGFSLNAQTKIVYEKLLENEAVYLKNAIAPATGFDIDTVPNGTQSSNRIVLQIDARVKPSSLKAKTPQAFSTASRPFSSSCPPKSTKAKKPTRFDGLYPQ